MSYWETALSEALDFAKHTVELMIAQDHSIQVAFKRIFNTDPTDSKIWDEVKGMFFDGLQQKISNAEAQVT